MLPKRRFLGNINDAISNDFTIPMAAQTGLDEFVIQIRCELVVVRAYDLPAQITVHDTSSVIGELDSGTVKTVLNQYTLVKVFVLNKIALHCERMACSFYLFERSFVKLIHYDSFSFRSSIKTLKSTLQIMISHNSFINDSSAIPLFSRLFNSFLYNAFPPLSFSEL